MDGHRFSEPVNSAREIYNTYAYMFDVTASAGIHTNSQNSEVYRINKRQTTSFYIIVVDC